jgi:hypothetical protein
MPAQMCLKVPGDIFRRGMFGTATLASRICTTSSPSAKRSSCVPTTEARLGQCSRPARPSKGCGWITSCVRQDICHGSCAESFDSFHMASTCDSPCVWLGHTLGRHNPCARMPRAIASKVMVDRLDARQGPSSAVMCLEDLHTSQQTQYITFVVIAQATTV